LGGFDALFANTNVILLVIFSICCEPIGLILGIVGLLVCSDTRAKQNAMLVTIIGGIITALAVMGNLANLVLQH
jgi:hypothetical protein